MDTAYKDYVVDEVIPETIQPAPRITSLDNYFMALMALILGIDRFMSMFRATVNMIGNAVAAIVLARWEKELDTKTLQGRLAMGPAVGLPTGQEAD